MISVETDSQFSMDSLMDTACGLAWGIARRPHRFHKGQKRGRGQITVSKGGGGKGAAAYESIETLLHIQPGTTYPISNHVGGSEL